MNDSRQLEITEQGRAALLREYEEAGRVASTRTRYADNTKRAYDQARERWIDECKRLGRPWAPIDPEFLRNYLEKLSETHAPNTVRLHLSALAALDKRSRITGANPNPQSIREHPRIVEWYGGWSRDNPTAPRRQAAALGQSDLERLLVAAQERPRGWSAAGHVARYTRDRALVLLGVAGAMRGAELVALQVADFTLGARGATLTIRRSKTDQHGAGEALGILPQGRAAVCAIAAYQAWVGLRGDTPGPLFCNVTRTGTVELDQALTERQVRRGLQVYAKRAGLDLVITNHSLRATLATQAAFRGKNFARIMQHGRWATAEVCARYVRQAQLFEDDNPTAGLFE